MDPRVQQAVRNNAIWCNAVCRAHGRPGEFLDGLWLNRQATPRFYPNVVTLANPDDPSAQVRVIESLNRSGLPGDWGVKDSFCALDLAALGFQVVVEAEWIWRPAALPVPPGDLPGIHWERIYTAAGLAAWEAAWDGEPQDAPAPLSARIFLPALLADPEIAIIAAYEGERIVAGAIGSRTGAVVGLSNLFAPDEDRVRFWAGSVASVTTAFPGLPLAGYEAGSELAVAQSLGFEAIGPLRVWIKMDRAA